MAQSNAADGGSIDAHAHWSPQPYMQYAEQQGGKVSGGVPSPLMYDLEARMKWMDMRNVKMHVLSLSGGMPWQWASLDAADKLARIVNDAAIEAHQNFPDRFVAAAAIPMRDPKAALRELDRIAGKPGIRAVHLPNSVEAASKLKSSVRDYIRRFHYDSLAYYPETLRFMIELVGSDRVVIGTDNYARMDVDQPNALVESLNLPAADLHRILHSNAAKLLRL